MAEPPRSQRLDEASSSQAAGSREERPEIPECHLHAVMKRPGARAGSSPAGSLTSPCLSPRSVRSNVDRAQLSRFAKMWTPPHQGQRCASQKSAILLGFGVLSKGPANCCTSAGAVQSCQLPLDTASRIDNLWQQATGHAVLQIRTPRASASWRRQRTAPWCSGPAGAHPRSRESLDDPPHPAVVSRQRVHLPTMAAPRQTPGSEFEPWRDVNPNRVSSSGRAVRIGSGWTNVLDRSALDGGVRVNCNPRTMRRPGRRPS